MSMYNPSKPFFTIVTISYNQVQYVKEAVESVLSQDFLDYEYIIWDGYSTDGSIELLQSFADLPQVKLVVQQDKGPADGLRRAFALARGSYYIYINSDDILLPSALSSMKDVVSKYPNSVISGSGIFIDELSRPISRISSDRFIFPLAVFGQCLIVQPSTIIPAELYAKSSGFNPLNLCNWDHELLLSLCEVGARFLNVPQCWSGYRLHESSITFSKKLILLHREYRYSLVKSFYPHLCSSGFSYNFALALFWLLGKIVYPKKTFTSFQRHLSSWFSSLNHSLS